MGQPELVKTSGVKRDEMHPDSVRRHFETSFERRSYNPLESSVASEALAAQIKDWREESKTVIFTSGVYDLFHANHRTYLLHTKLAAVPYRWGRLIDDGRGCRPWESVSEADQISFTDHLIAHDSLKLVVSVDGNMAVGARKGNQESKGGTPRPIYDWRTRSRDVLSAGFELRPGVFKPIADAVTIHDNKQPELADTPHAGILEIAQFVKPDVWSVYHESDDIIDAVQTSHADRFRGVDVRILPGHRFYHDELLEDTFSTTGIVNRVLGGVALNGKGGN